MGSALLLDLQMAQWALAFHLGRSNIRRCAHSGAESGPAIRQFLGPLCMFEDVLGCEPIKTLLGPPQDRPRPHFQAAFIEAAIPYAERKLSVLD